MCLRSAQVSPRHYSRWFRFGGRSEPLLVALGSSALCTVWALVVGKDLGWDLRNYHYYIAYAWLNGVSDFHILPSQTQSWLNPLVHVPHYLLIRYAPPAVAGGVFGAWAGVNIALIYGITRQVFPVRNKLLGVALALVASAVAFSTPHFLEAIGTTSSDIVAAIPILSGLLVLFRSLDDSAERRRAEAGFFLTGVLFGIACGLKLTSLIYAQALTITLLVLWPLLKPSWRAYLLYALGGFAGFALTGGYWAWHLWSEYRNPTFPYWNTWFRSRWAITYDFRDLRFLPTSFQAALSYPLQWFLGYHPTHELPFRDARFLILMVLLLMLFVAAIDRFLLRHLFGRASAESAPFIPARYFWLLLLFSIFSYVIWLRTFAVQRFLVPLSMLCSVLLLLAVDRLIARANRKYVCFILVSAFCVLWSRTAGTTRLPYDNDWFGINLPAALRRADSLIVMLGDTPMAYVVPSLPASSRVIRLTGSMPLDRDTQLGRKARELLRAHAGPMWSLASGPLGPQDEGQLRAFGLVVDWAACSTFSSYADTFTTCPIHRASLVAPGDARPIE